MVSPSSAGTTVRFALVLVLGASCCAWWYQGFEGFHSMSSNADAETGGRLEGFKSSNCMVICPAMVFWICSPDLSMNIIWTSKAPKSRHPGCPMRPILDSDPWILDVLFQEKHATIDILTIYLLHIIFV